MEKGNHDIFDRLMGLPGLRIFQPFYAAHKEVLLYLFFGGLTTVISIVSFALFMYLGMDELLANIPSWIIAVMFAFVTNRIWVFRAPTSGAAEFLRQMASFFAGRVATLLMEELILFVFITKLGLWSLGVKIAAQFAVIVAKYVISKLFVFRKGPVNGKGTDE